MKSISKINIKNYSKNMDIDKEQICLSINNGRENMKKK